MSKVLFFNLLIFLLTFHSFSNEQKSNDDSVSASDTSKTIEIIKQKFKEINSNLNTYQKVQKEVTDRTSEGSELTGYFDEDTLKKISIIDMGEMGRVITEYYLKNGKPFFIFKEAQFYDQPFYESASKIVSTKQDRYYFADTNLVQWLNNEKKKADLSDKRYKKEIAVFFKDVKKFFKELYGLKK